MMQTDSGTRRRGDAIGRVKLKLRRRLRHYEMHVRKHLRPGGVLPDMLIIGAMKCGTTTLFRMLEQHPGFVPPRAKEIQYFNQPRNHARGAAWYRAHFPDARQMRTAERRLGYRPISGEATPAMSAPMFARNAAALVPEARLIVTLRNPVDRAWSHYQHYQRHPEPDPVDFATAIERELDWIARGYRLTEDNFLELAHQMHRLGYIVRGHYAEQLENWFRHFRRDQFLILDFEHWTQNPLATAARIAQHAGLPPHHFEVIRANAGGYNRQMPSACRDRLTEHFRPWNRRLFKLLGEDWGWPS